MSRVLEMKDSVERWERQGCGQLAVRFTYCTSMPAVAHGRGALHSNHLSVREREG